MKQKLSISHLQQLSSILLELSLIRNEMGTFTTLHALVCAEIKVKVDKHIASGQISPAGVRIKLTPAQYHVVKFISDRNMFSKEVVFRNAVLRLMVLNK